MASIFTFSNIKDFNGNLTDSNKEHFRTLINSTTAITQKCDEIRINVDVVELWFDAPMSTEAEAALSSLILSKYMDPYIFDAIVDARGNGNYTHIADAFADGKTSVYVRDGVYVETANIVIPDGGQLVGESQSNVKIVFFGPFSVVVDGSQGVKINTGTVAIANATNQVNGSGTNFLSLLPSSFILLGTNFFQIQSVETDTTLTLKEIYRGKSLTGLFCLAQQMFTGVKISNIIIANSASTGLFIRGVRHCGFKGVAVLNCTPNVKIIDSGDSSLYEFICGFSNGIGVLLDNAHSMLCDTLDIYNSTSHGIELQSKSSSNVFDACSTSNNGGIGFNVSGSAFDINIADTVIKHNNNYGLVTEDGSNQIIVSGCTVVENLLSGIKLGGSFGVVSNNVIKQNGGCGLEGGRNCTVTGNQVCENTADGFYYHHPNSIILTANRLHGNGSNGINTESDKSVIANNIICNSAANGILYGGANGNVSGNIVSNNVADGIHFSATTKQTIIAQNQSVTNQGNGMVFDAGSNNNLSTYNVLSGNISGNSADEGTANDFFGNKIF